MDHPPGRRAAHGLGVGRVARAPRHLRAADPASGSPRRLRTWPSSGVDSVSTPAPEPRCRAAQPLAEAAAGAAAAARPPELASELRGRARRRAERSATIFDQGCTSHLDPQRGCKSNPAASKSPCVAEEILEMRLLSLLVSSRRRCSRSHAAGQLPLHESCCQDSPGRRCSSVLVRGAARSASTCCAVDRQLHGRQRRLLRPGEAVAEPVITPAAPPFAKPNALSATAAAAAAAASVVEEPVRPATRASSVVSARLRKSVSNGLTALTIDVASDSVTSEADVTGPASVQPLLRREHARAAVRRVRRASSPTSTSPRRTPRRRSRCTPSTPRRERRRRRR